MRLSQEVQESDVNEAINLMKVATQESAIDPNTGLIDMDMINTGRSTALRTRIKTIADKLKEHIKSNVAKYRRGVNFEFIEKQLETLVAGDEDDQKLSDLQIREALKSLASEDVIVTYGDNKMRPSVKIVKDNYQH